MSFLKELVDAESWDYRGEGAANVVLAYRGEEEALHGKVLRLQKAVAGDSAGPVLSAEEQRLWADFPRLVSATNLAELNHVYADDVLRPLLGDGLVEQGVLARVPSSFLEALNSKIGHKRPAWRAKSAPLEALSSVGFVISDHARFPSRGRDSAAAISVELKPKCGFLPQSLTATEENSSAKRRVSRFAMHQHLKLEQGQVTQLSKYDPLDLFSGTKDGILRAIRALFETPQNNLRVFIDGDEVFGQAGESPSRDTPSIARFEDLLTGFVTAAPSHSRVESFQELLADLLLESGVLGKLLAVQKLDYANIEGAMRAYEEFLRLHGTNLEAKHSGADRRGEPGKELADSSSQCARILRDFLISTTAKDCGVMVTLRPSARAEGDMEHKIRLLDLDIKRLKKMHKYSALDREIVDCYTSSVAGSTG